MTVPRIALVMAIRQVDAAMRHFSFQHQSPIEALGVGMRVSRPGGDAGHALAAEAYSYFQHPADDRRQAPLPPLSYRMAPRRLAAGRHVRSIINDNAYADRRAPPGGNQRSEEHTSELQSLMRTS